MLTFLLSLTSEQNREKVEYLFTTFHDDVLRYAKSRLRGKSYTGFDAEDVVQEAYIKVIKYIERIDFSVGDASLKSYLFSVVDHKTIDMLKGCEFHENLENYENELEDEDFLEKLRILDEAKHVREALKQLPIIYTITLRCRFYGNMSMKEIADYMDVPENTVKSRIKRGKRMLFDVLQRSEVK